MKKVMTILFCIGAMAAVAQATTTINFGDINYTPSYAASHYAAVWDLTQGDLVLTYTIDMSAVTQTAAYETPYVEVGLRQVGAGDFNPGPFNVYQGGAGGWMTSLVSDLATNPASLDLDDKHNLNASGGRGEADYDVYGADMDTVLTPFGNSDSYGFWYDRDGVDPYQNADIANTGGTYNITILYHAINAGLGSMIATINGSGVDIAQVFDLPPDDGIFSDPAGLSFTGDMTQMQVFTGAWWTGGAGGSVQVSNITATGTLVPEPATLVLLGLGGLFCRKIKKV